MAHSVPGKVIFHLLFRKNIQCSIISRSQGSGCTQITRSRCVSQYPCQRCPLCCSKFSFQSGFLVILLSCGNQLSHQLSAPLVFPFYTAYRSICIRCVPLWFCFRRG